MFSFVTGCREPSTQPRSFLLPALGQELLVLVVAAQVHAVRAADVAHAVAVDVDEGVALGALDHRGGLELLLQQRGERVEDAVGGGEAGVGEVLGEEVGELLGLGPLLAPVHRELLERRAAAGLNLRRRGVGHEEVVHGVGVSRHEAPDDLEDERERERGLQGHEHAEAAVGDDRRRDEAGPVVGHAGEVVAANSEREEPAANLRGVA